MRIKISSGVALACLLGTPASLHAQTTWERVDVIWPDARDALVMAHDTRRDVTVMFGGWAPSDETWIIDGSRWSRCEPTRRPPARGNAAMAYDAARDRVVLFGGQAYGIHYGDTWEWDGSEWIERTPASSPRLTPYPAMAYDPIRQRIVVVSYRETWEWDGSNWAQVPNGWIRHTIGTTLAWDASRGRVVAFGGYDGATSVTDEMLAFDGNAWTPILQSARAPRRMFHSLVYDTHRDRLVLFGGQGSYTGTPLLDDTWEFDGAGWVQVSTTSSPSPRRGHAAAYDAAQRSVLIFGGRNLAQHLRSAWRYDGTSWADVSGFTTPPNRSSFVMGHDPVRNQTILHGGSTGSTLPTDTWEWTGSQWLERRPSTVPPGRWSAAMAFHPGRGHLLLVGGRDTSTSLDDVWEWNGSIWSEIQSSVRPPGRFEHAMARHDNQVVLFGGRAQWTTPAHDETWTFDGSTWTQHPGPAPPARTRHALAYDESRDVSVLFGGVGTSGLLADTWEWDGQAWTQRHPATVPPARELHRLAFDRSRQRVVLTGGAGFGSGYDDTWEWVSGNWMQRVASGPYFSGTNSGMVYHDDAREMFVHDAFNFASWRYGANEPAAFRLFGQGCAGTNGIPILQSRHGDLPWTGESFEIEYRNLPSGTSGVLAIGVSNQVWLGLGLPLDLTPIGMTACTLFTSGEFQLPVQARGTAGLTVIPIPADPNLAGDRLFFQLFVFDALANPFMATLSSAAEGVMGNK